MPIHDDGEITGEELKESKRQRARMMAAENGHAAGAGSLDPLDGRLKAAIDNLEKLRGRLAPGISDEDWYTLYDAGEVLGKFIDSERRSSPIEKLSRCDEK